MRPSGSSSAYPSWLHSGPRISLSAVLRQVNDDNDWEEFLFSPQKYFKKEKKLSLLVKVVLFDAFDFCLVLQKYSTCSGEHNKVLRDRKKPITFLMKIENFHLSIRLEFCYPES